VDSLSEPAAEPRRVPEPEPVNRSRGPGPRWGAGWGVWLLVAVAGCGREPILHGLDERQANQVLTALDESGLSAAKQRDEGTEAAWRVEVPGSEAARARRILSERELPRPESGGFAQAFARQSLVPTPAEERARLLQALAGELSRTVEAVDGVVEARVHLALAPDDPLRAGLAPRPRGAVLVKVRPGARPRVEPLAPGIRSLVAGAVAGLDPADVAVVLAEASPAPVATPPSPPNRGLVALGAVAGALGLGLLAASARSARIPWPRLRWPG
jgi:type III secretion protein J